MRARRLAALVLCLAPLIGGAALLANDAWIGCKAAVARVLIDRAFDAHLSDGRPHRPWSWADTHPVAELAVPRLAVRRVVLDGSSGSSLAFGPGHVDGTASPNEPGNCVLAGHRDGAFAFLERLAIGDTVTLRTRAGTIAYRVASLSVRGERDGAALAPSARHRLTLVTCYPFGGLRRSPLRYVVACTRAGNDEGRCGTVSAVTAGAGHGALPERGAQR